MTSASGVQALMGAKGLAGSAAEGGAPLHNREGASAAAAKRMVQAVQQFVAMLQIQQVPPGHQGPPCRHAVARSD